MKGEERGRQRGSSVHLLPFLPVRPLHDHVGFEWQGGMLMHMHMLSRDTVREEKLALRGCELNREQDLILEGCNAPARRPLCVGPPAQMSGSETNHDQSPRGRAYQSPLGLLCWGVTAWLTAVPVSDREGCTRPKAVQARPHATTLAPQHSQGMIC